MQIYQDLEGPKKRPNLIDGLMRWPTTQALHPQENQFTEALAWLADRSPVFARALVGLFVPARDQEFLAALEGNPTIGARTQLTCRARAAPGRYFPTCRWTGVAAASSCSSRGRSARSSTSTRLAARRSSNPTPTSRDGSRYLSPLPRTCIGWGR